MYAPLHHSRHMTRMRCTNSSMDGGGHLRFRSRIQVLTTTCTNWSDDSLLLPM